MANVSTAASTPQSSHPAGATGPHFARQQCLNAACGAVYPVTEVRTGCAKCGELLDVVYDWPKDYVARNALAGFAAFSARGGAVAKRSAPGLMPTNEASLDYSGVWRFRELLPFYQDASKIVTIGEGRTILQRADHLACDIGMDLQGGGELHLQYEGFNPSGSFKDNGMAAGFTHARMVGAKRVACASTGNTSAAMAVFGSLTGMHVYVFIGAGKIAYGKLSQALEYGAKTLQVDGDFDACLARVRQIAETRPEHGVYLMNSVNPFRLEGQKAIMFRILEGLGWEVPDWIIVPGGNLGNCSAFAKAFIELKQLGLIDRVPRLAIIQAQGSRTLDRVVNELGAKWTPAADSALMGSYDRATVQSEYARMDAKNERAKTVATAIEINRPVNLSKALRALHAMNGVVRSVSDEEIVEHKAMVGKWGYGCEPASGASVAGLRMLMKEGLITPQDRVACVLTGHVLKDPDVTVAYHTGVEAKAAAVDLSASKPNGRISNPPIRVPDDVEAILKAMGV